MPPLRCHDTLHFQMLLRVTLIQRRHCLLLTFYADMRLFIMTCFLLMPYYFRYADAAATPFAIDIFAIAIRHAFAAITLIYAFSFITPFCFAATRWRYICRYLCRC